jgi:hypothetical protein
VRDEFIAAAAGPSIREHLVCLHAGGNLLRDAATGVWTWSRFTSYFTVAEGPCARLPPSAHGVPARAEDS